MTIAEHVPLSPLTTFKLGGLARYFTHVQNVQEVQEALAYAKEKNLRTFVLGGGSNVLIADEGFGGLVIKIGIKGIEVEEGVDSYTKVFSVGAGENWDKLVERVVQEGLWGIENLSGIPGEVGGAVVQNVGAYGAALSQSCTWVEVFDAKENKVRTLSKEECAFGYRDNIFKREEGRYTVLRAAFALSTTPAPNVSYKDLHARFAGKSPGLIELRTAILAIRAQKFPDLTISGSAGSFFKNPILPAAQAHRLREQYPELPLFLLPESSDIKVPLGWFLDYRHGVIDLRDISVGGARMYEKHFLVVVAERGSSARDVQELSRIVQKKVMDACNIAIEPEVKILY